MRAVLDSIRRVLAIRLTLLLALMLAAGAIGPAPLAADSGPAALALTGCMAPQRPGDRPEALLAPGARFDCQPELAVRGPGDYWLRLSVPAGTGEAFARAGEMPYLRFIPQWQHSLTIYSRDAGGVVIARQLDNDDISRRLIIGGAIGLALDGHRQPLTGILVRADGALNASGVLLGPRLVTDNQLQADELVATAIFAAFAGLGIGLFCYNLVLWRTTRERFQLTYCLSLLAMLAYVWASSGALALQFRGIPQDVRLQVCYSMLAFVGALALQFITDIMEPGMVPPRLRCFARHYGTASALAALAVALAPEEWRHVADRVFVYSFLPLPPLVLAITWTAWRRGSRAVRVLTIAWALPLAMGVVRIAHALHLIAPSPLVQYSLVIGFGVEALLSSLAMAYRIKLITTERDRALTDEQAARHLASVDSLTGLLNRRALLEHVIDWSSPEPLRLLIVDIDHFKAINDSHGHLVGDEVIRALAEVLAIRADLRASVARLGGEEFALVGTIDELDDTVPQGILDDVRTHTLAGDVSITVSIGIADGFVRCEDEWRELYRRADAALYRAKAEGRDRAVHATGAERDHGHGRHYTARSPAPA